ncbi:hypothetical protein C8J57DRAFT_1171957 [Mycena rebaudengoi]|nr:hypothetical protein C8J57DRAFT_1171957 [Mycena rebaudengoi]
MSTASPPSYIPGSDTFHRTPSYSAEPRFYEQRLALNARSLPQHTGNFVKTSKGGGTQLRLSKQQDSIDLPVYGSGGLVEGTIELSKTDGISTVQVKVEGRLELKEIAEGGHIDTKLCLDTVLLWIKDGNNAVCPSSLQFALTLPTTFTHEGRSYPLPPSHSAKLKGLPGFYATIDYSVSAIINKPHSIPNMVPLVKSKKLGINIGNTTVSTPFVYFPRTRPAVPIPSPLSCSDRGFLARPDWRLYESTIKAKKSGAQDITSKLYVPESRIFCASMPIPFHLTFESSALSLAAFLPFGPTGGTSGKPRATRVQLMRHTSVDVRNLTLQGVKTDMWRTDCIGEGVFRHAGDGPTSTSFSGEITLSEPIKVTGFRCGGLLTVQDCILLTVTPPDVTKSPFVGIREVVPVRLTTDKYTEDGRGIPERVSIPSSPEESLNHAL